MSPFMSLCSHVKLRIGLALLIGLLLLTSGLDTEAVQAQSDVPPENTEELYLPVFSNNPRLASRMGYGVTWPEDGTLNDILTFEKSSELRAGWFLNWGAHRYPPKPNGIEFVQMVRVHQSLGCEDDDGKQRWWFAFRDECPYEEPVDGPSSYRYQPTQANIERAVRANPGSLWLIGNEIEREDWAACWIWNEQDPLQCDYWIHKGQDEILPASYAMAYHELYGIIKTIDPTAKVAIGGVIQVTPIRLEYLTAIWENYQLLYEETMPVDVWNTHTFVFSEAPEEAAGRPVGITSDTEGIYLDSYSEHIHMPYIQKQVEDMRQWMKDRGQQEKPLIISEYGPVYPNSFFNEQSDDPTKVIEYLIESSTYFLNAKDCNLGYSADDCRLVQRWNWFSLDGRRQGANEHATLYNVETGELTPAGLAWKEFVEANEADLFLD